MNTRLIASKLVGFATLLATLVIWWQVYRFWQGDIGVPLIDLFYEANPQVVSDSWIYHLLHFVLGTSTWFAISALVLFFGSILSRILEVGVMQFVAEQQKVFEDAKSHEAIDSRKSTKEDGRSSGFGPFIAGLFFGWLITK